MCSVFGTEKVKKNDEAEKENIFPPDKKLRDKIFMEN
jgi:hypothetical protein